ncbi:unnamed protein product [Natator depressus]
MEISKSISRAFLLVSPLSHRVGKGRGFDGRPQEQCLSVTGSAKTGSVASISNSGKHKRQSFPAESSEGQAQLAPLHHSMSSPASDHIKCGVVPWVYPQVCTWSDGSHQELRW